MDIQEARELVKQEEEKIRLAIQVAFDTLSKAGLVPVKLDYDVQLIHKSGGRTRYKIDWVEIKVQL